MSPRLHLPPRASLAALPTPLTPAPRLSDALGVEIWCKRDDLTGLGLGGNKVRALEFVIGAALAADADVLVTGGGPQSNWVLLAALSAVCSGLRAHVVLYGDAPAPTGNLRLLTALPDVAVTWTGDTDRASVDAGLDRAAAALRDDGARPYVIGRGGASPTGAVGYVLATTELDDQLCDAGVRPAAVWLATGSCGTIAGLVAGHALSRLPPREVVGVSVSRPVDECRARIARLADGALDLLDTGTPRAAGWTVTGDQLGSYGRASQAGEAAAALVARTEGILLDPVFGAKAMAGLVAAAREGAVAGPVVFLVSGGAPTLFAAGMTA